MTVLWETLNKSPRTSWRRIFHPSALQKFEIHKVFLHFCAQAGKKSARQGAHVDLFSVFLEIFYYQINILKTRSISTAPSARVA